jgi:hypothetical protein
MITPKGSLDVHGVDVLETCRSNKQWPSHLGLLLPACTVAERVTSRVQDTVVTAYGYVTLCTTVSTTP